MPDIRLRSQAIPVLLTTALIAVPVFPDSNAADAAPSGEAVVSTFLAAVGGAEAVEAVESFHVRGKYVLTSQGVEGTIELHFARPDRLLMTVEFPGFGQVRRGYDGRVGWSTHPQQGTRVLEGAELDHLRTQAERGFSLLPDAGIFERMDHEGTAEFEGRPCHKVRLVVASTGFEYVDFYDVETGLFAGRSEHPPNPAGKIEMLGTAADYKTFGALTIPTSWTHRMAGQEWSAHYETFEANAVEAAVFELPEEVRAKLAEGRAAGEKVPHPEVDMR